MRENGASDKQIWHCIRKSEWQTVGEMWDNSRSAEPKIDWHPESGHRSKAVLVLKGAKWKALRRGQVNLLAPCQARKKAGEYFDECLRFYMKFVRKERKGMPVLQRSWCVSCGCDRWWIQAHLETEVQHFGETVWLKQMRLWFLCGGNLLIENNEWLMIPGKRRWQMLRIDFGGFSVEGEGN